MRIRLLLAGAALPLALWAALPLASDGAAPQSRLNDIEKKIQATQGRIGRRKGTERVLTTQISAYSTRIGTLEARIGRLQRRQAAVQSDLDHKRAELTRLQSDLRAERRRLVRLRARLAEARAARTISMILWSCSETRSMNSPCSSRSVKPRALRTTVTMSGASAW